MPLPRPEISFDGTTGEWVLDRTFTCRGFMVPAGFRFDLASVPRSLWWLIAPFELSVPAAMIHDFLYRRGGEVKWSGRRWRESRRGCDRVFRTLMHLDGVPRWRRVLAYMAVRLFGWMAWRGN